MLLACAALLHPLAAQAQSPAPPSAPPALALPLDCRPGVDCWVANYVDVDPTPAAADFRCGPRSYDAHEGVDIAIRDLGVMARGVAVLAAAPGTVRNVRDGMPDEPVGDAASRARIAGRECGNGVLLEHGGGWQTQYCHLRNGSVRVAPGQAVQAGTPLAQVGLSGQTEFPHLHIQVRQAGRTIDPFSGQAAGAGCAATAAPLWRAQAHLAYEELALYNAGFAIAAPDIAAIRRGERSDGPLAPDAPALVLWVDVLGVRSGDRLRLRITAPDGAVLVDSEQPLERNRARHYAFAGKRRTLPAWPSGVYEGTITHRRGADAVTVRSERIVVE